MPEYTITIEGQTHDLAALAVLGRGESADIRIDSKKLSRMHARLTVVENKLYVEDLDSKNGTFVNGQRIAQRRELIKGDQLKFGDMAVTLAFPQPQGAPSESAPAAPRKERQARSGEIEMIKKLAAVVIGLILLFAGWRLLDSGDAAEREKAQNLLDRAARLLEEIENGEVPGLEALTSMGAELDRVPADFPELRKKARDLQKQLSAAAKGIAARFLAEARERQVRETYDSIWAGYLQGLRPPEDIIKALNAFLRANPDFADNDQIRERITQIRREVMGRWEERFNGASARIDRLMGDGKFREAADALQTALKGELASAGLPPELRPRLDALRGREEDIAAAARKWFDDFAARHLAGLADGDAEKIAGMIEAEYNRLGLEANKLVLDRSLAAIAQALEARIAAFRQAMQAAEQAFARRDYRQAHDLLTALIKEAGPDSSLASSAQDRLWQSRLLAEAKAALIAAAARHKDEVKIQGLGTVAAIDNAGLTVSLEGQSTRFAWKTMGRSTFGQLLTAFAAKTRQGILSAAYAWLAAQQGNDAAADTFIVRAVKQQPDLEERYAGFVKGSLVRVAAREKEKRDRDTLLKQAAAEKLEEHRRKLAGRGIAGRYIRDRGLERDPAVLYFMDCDNESKIKSWSRGVAGYGWTAAKENVFSGEGAMEIQQKEGTHNPSEIHPRIKATDVAYVRWYRKWEEGYDWTQHKMPGVYAKAPGVGGGGAGQKPNGKDKYSCKLYADWNGVPHFYSYHPDQKGGYGDGLKPNLGGSVRLQTGRWYCMEMMIKANNAPERDGELKMWLDGKLIAHYKDLRFRDTNDLQINEFTYSAYVGGLWSSKRDQKLWDDQIVVATEYIGPMRQK